MHRTISHIRQSIEEVIKPLDSLARGEYDNPIAKVKSAEIGRISGNGWAFGYIGGLVTLIIMLVLLAENASTGKTLIGISPILGLDAEAREGTRSVGPLTAA